MDKIVSNRFYVTAISDGSTLSAVLYSTSTLTQVYNPLSGACTPNWNDPNNQPIVYVISMVNGTVKAPNSASVQWLYNNTVITFDNNGMSNGAFVDAEDNPLFQKTVFSVSGLTMPALKILRNLASVGNTDNDVISLKGTIEMGGSQVPFSVSTPVRITQQSSSGYYGYVYGDASVSSATPNETGYVATMYTALYNGANQVTGESQYSTKWYREGIDENPFATAYSSASGACTAQINASQIDDNVVIRVEFYDAAGTKVYTAFWNVDDLVDPEKMYISHGLNNENNASLFEGERVVFRIWMGHNEDASLIDARYTQFKVKMTDSENNTILCKRVTEGADSYVIAADSQAGTERVDITANNVQASGNVTAAKGGLATITYDFVNGHGGTVTGLVTAYGADN